MYVLNKCFDFDFDVEHKTATKAHRAKKAIIFIFNQEEVVAKESIERSIRILEALRTKLLLD